MTSPSPLPPAALCHRIDTGAWTFRSTAELEDLADVVGQARATGAIRFGIGIRHDGYNLFVLGPPSTGNHAIVRRFLAEQAAGEPIPCDWCYVNNFDQPHKPRVLRLPAGQGARLRADMEELIADLKTAIPATFESDEYRARRHEIEQEFKERRGKVIQELERDADGMGIAVIHTPTGIAFAPKRAGEVMSPEEFEKLPAEKQKSIEQQVLGLRQRLEQIFSQLPVWQRETQQQMRELDRQVVMAAVGHLISTMKARYAEWPPVIAYLDAVEKSVVDNADDFRRQEDGPELTLFGITVPRGGGEASLRRYVVNLLIDQGVASGAPVVYVDNPSYAELVGRVEHMAQMGTLLTDFTLIKPGALHRANGGYLVLDARRVLLQPFAWEALKRCLSAKQVRIEEPGQMLSLVSTVSLEPEPIPLDVKVVLVGERLLYYLLHQFDPDFRELFKVAADFEEDVDRSPANVMLHARLIATLARREQLLPFQSDAVARVLEQCSRAAFDADKLSVRVQDITDLLRESDHLARAAKQKSVRAEDVGSAVAARIGRSARIRDRLQEQIRNGTVMIDTDGVRVGQVNGLSVVTLGELSFGHPVRITARVRLGKGEVVDIEREVELGGPIHSKGVLILAGLLGQRYCRDRPLSLAASLVFEQSYGRVDGDSASCAEMCALLSALADVPIRQSLAITGSVNQHGEVQAIGGVNEKIEGHFDICRARGLGGDHGVLIPAANVRHLMLRDDVVQACATGKFHVYPVTTVDEAMELLTGIAAGKRGADGRFPDGSVNQRVEQRLAELAERARAYMSAPAEPTRET
jgi:lon-related putative ATP-dependent protease